MNAYVNYLIEANVALVVIFCFYRLFLSQESNFLFRRAFLLAGIAASVLFPLLHLDLNDHATLPTLGGFLPAYWLPGITINGDGTAKAQSITIWSVISVLYWIGFVCYAIRLGVQLFMLWRTIRRGSVQRSGDFNIVAADQNQSSFSFFHFIFIGQADGVSEEDRMQIIRHERVHAQRFHSVDMLLVNTLGVIFWFNPLIRSYKKNFIQVHEFEADARAVENYDVNKYCSLLARVALLSADIPIANHFNNSLTLKRIEMLKAMKQKIRGWKIATALTSLPLLFFFIACQDQVMDNVKSLAATSAMATDVPADVQAQIDKLRAANPDTKLVVIETTTEEGKATLNQLDENKISSMHVFKHNEGTDNRSFVVLQMDATGQAIQSQTTTDDGVFLVVDEPAQFKGGMERFGELVMANLSYPTEASTKGIEGNTYISFVVEKNGSLSNIEVMRGFHPTCDKEALRVIGMSPAWIPGKQNGQTVRSKMVIPVAFRLN